MLVSHKNILVKVNKYNQLVHPIVKYSKEDALASIVSIGSINDLIHLVDDERLVSLSDLMLLNIDAYTEALLEACSI